MDLLARLQARIKSEEGDRISEEHAQGWYCELCEDHKRHWPTPEEVQHEPDCIIQLLKEAAAALGQKPKAPPASPAQILQRAREGMDRYLPDHMRAGMHRYLEQGIRPGDFMYLMLCGDLEGAKARADQTNRAHWDEWQIFLFDFLPIDCHNTPEKVAAWIAHRGLLGRPDGG